MIDGKEQKAGWRDDVESHGIPTGWWPHHLKQLKQACGEPSETSF